ncbi:hypothetical protein AWM68_13110 [Fictibacillus phosphorivorans]|uniref:Uncharacterized protein n=1 Tax=Fictibacillus phosphorivorans TaxID=1221500 RepID=A0A161TGQ8_9BACL|nr:hypothetical protein [Fictibacillus phosphorivorans]KZE64042.1 hypothetical protein AWM68_13110 [Fictibacillus phosphorivorans]
MSNQVGIKFTYYRNGTTISQMTDYDDIQEVMNQGFESVAVDCIQKVFHAIGLDLDQLSYPHPATRFCFFSELSYDTNQMITEGKRRPVLSKKKDLVY